MQKVYLRRHAEISPEMMHAGAESRSRDVTSARGGRRTSGLGGTGSATRALDRRYLSRLLIEAGGDL